MASQNATGKRKRPEKSTEFDTKSQQPSKRRKLNPKDKQDANDLSILRPLLFNIPSINDIESGSSSISVRSIHDIENFNSLNIYNDVNSDVCNNNEMLSFIYESDLDANGFIYYLGTKNKTCNVFTNPATIGKISTSCSSLLSNSKSAEYIISRKPQRLITQSVRDSWFIIDFRPCGYEIIPNYYTLRHYASTDNCALRNWYLKGSNDGKVWNILREHNNHTSLQIKNKPHSWNINTSHAYSIFKIQQFGKNSGDGYNLACCGFEIYGHVKKIKNKQINQKMEANDSDSDIEILSPNKPKNKIVSPSKSDISDAKEESVDNSPNPPNKTMAMDHYNNNNNNNNNYNNISISPREELCNMGFNDYMVNESLKYTNNDLNSLMDWINQHEMTGNEELNLKITNICDIMLCERYQSLYALKQCNNNTQNAMQLLVDANLNTTFIVPNNNSNINKTNIFENLSKNDINNLKTEDKILSATILSIHEQRKKEQQFKKLKPIILSELRSMGFLQIAVQKALNNKLVKDKKSAIQFILNNPLNDIQEKNAKIEEIINSGYCRNDAINALNKYSQNLNMAISWLMQGKPLTIKHFIYHVSSKNIMQICIENNNNCPELTENVNVKNMNQHWSFYKNGKIKNFANNKILAVRCNKNEGISYDLCLIIDEIKEDENKENNNENNNLGIYKYWEIDENDKIIKNKECNLYLVYRNDTNKFYLESTMHIGDMEQRWCFIDENQLIKINPKELHRLLDSQEFECVICWENEPNIRLEPCGHSSFCRKCINDLKPNECPICRTKIHSKQQFENE